MTSIKKIGKHIKKGTEKAAKSEAAKTTGDVALEIAETTPPGEIAAAIVAENEQEKDK